MDIYSPYCCININNMFLVNSNKSYVKDIFTTCRILLYNIINKKNYETEPVCYSPKKELD